MGCKENNLCQPMLVVWSDLAGKAVPLHKEMSKPRKNTAICKAAEKQDFCMAWKGFWLLKSFIVCQFTRAAITNPQIGCLKIRKVYSFRVLEARRQIKILDGTYFHWRFWGRIFPCLVLVSGGSWQFRANCLACRCITVISAFIFTQPSSLVSLSCLYVQISLSFLL